VTTRARSLQTRLLAQVLGTVLVVWGVVAALMWYDAQHELGELLDGHLAQAAAMLVVQHAEIANDHVVAAPTLNEYAPRVAFQVLRHGKLALRSANAPAWFAGADEAFDSGFRTLTVDGDAWRVFAARGTGTDLQVYVGEQLSSRSEILAAVLRSTLFPMLLALPLLGISVWWAVSRSLAPLRLLGQTLADRPAKALQQVEVGEAPLEMQPLLAALNGLFARIGELLDSERRFTADAAHELRTPIAAIRAQAQVALGERDEAARRHALLATLEGCDRATRLVDQLLTLSRLEAETAKTDREVDFGALVRGTVAEIAPRAIAKRQDIEVEAAPDAALHGEETLLRVLVRNLVDNAVRYSHPGARISVRVAHEGTTISLMVDDSGPGLSEPDRARLGERFFRVPGSDESGSGLGWSIVRRIATAHRAQVAAEWPSALGGLAVRVSFPTGAGVSRFGYSPP
jgi:two-component system, OmpR family, sensor histidine kinase QseC